METMVMVITENPDGTAVAQFTFPSGPSRTRILVETEADMEAQWFEAYVDAASVNQVHVVFDQIKNGILVQSLESNEQHNG